MNQNLILSDIEGAKTGSLKKGIISKRTTNPLNPAYILPGNLELEKNNNPYGDTLLGKNKLRTETSLPNEDLNSFTRNNFASNKLNNPINGKIEYLFF